MSGRTMDRRHVVAGGLAAAAAPALPKPALALAWERATHGLSTFGELKYPAGFLHFDYVNPAAPKGGAFSNQASRVAYNQNFNTFNSLNMFILRGDGAQGMELTFDTLMVRALDEPDALYGLVADRVLIEDGGRTYRFRLRHEARWHDGTPLTANDVAWSLETLKAKGHPLISQAIRQMDAAVADADDVVTVRLGEGHSRELILTIAALPVLSKAFYASHPFDETTLVPPLASGPYRLGRFEQGRFNEFERVADYWGRDLPVTRGHWNFDRIRFEYFRDREVAFEGFKARAFTFREEFTSRVWATRYDFPAFKEGRVKREVLPDETPSGTQGWFMNLRRPQFADRRVREALALAFDFEWTNETLMYGAYERTWSFFQNTDMAAKGPPSAAERALLDPWRGKVPDEVFGEPWRPPVSDRSGQDRALLRRAGELLREAGCRREGDGLRLPGGQPFQIEFLDFDFGLHPHTDGLIKNLRLLGIEGTKRTVDPAQFQRRLDDFDYDMVSRRYSTSPTPGDGLRLIYGSEAARTRGSRNISGIADPALDALLAVIADAGSRAELATACTALDRILRSHRIWIPMWSKGSHWIAYWDVFGRPATKPKYDRGAPLTWWYDDAKAKRIGL